MLGPSVCHGCSKANQNIIHCLNVLFHTLRLRILPVHIVDNNTSSQPRNFLFFFYIFIMNSLSKKMCHDEYWIHFGQRWKETISCCSGTFWQCANPQEVFCDFFQGPDLLESTWSALPSCRTKEQPCNCKASVAPDSETRAVASKLRPGGDLTRASFTFTSVPGAEVMW